MRNQPVRLTHDEYQHVVRVAHDLMDAVKDDRPVTLEYTKRNGQDSSSTGKIDGFIGDMTTDKGSVNIVDTAKGIRTINLVRVKRIL